MRPQAECAHGGTWGRPDKRREDAGSPNFLKLAVPVLVYRTCMRSSPASSSQSSSPCTASASQMMVLHAADGILQEPKVHTRPLLPSELFYSMVSLCRVSLLPPPAPPPSLPVAQFAFTPPFFTDMAHDSGVLRLDVPRKWLGCCPDYMSSHQLGLEACLPPSACCSWRFLADGAAGHRPGLWNLQKAISQDHRSPAAEQICVDFREFVTFFSQCSQGSWFTTSDTRSAVTPATFGIPTEPTHQRSCGCTLLPDCRTVRINHSNQNLFLETL
ncbi:guanine nucleotide-binding protein G(I)/G(S)/G(O) subunit gamma-13 isoform X2 [Pteropus alecto]|uniref:guanine nucleotide-binding protein G(I)/G(S)/G(O) subunit gamma-13 isoform X2 n=1 Tax=Pteropus alecto TaxID=9402 RepID=UPI000D536F63|nr:guanine nucleotide-binding protein G(I)/G(S)/G(O) subunit gamma-13 isoform X2 [Pteropus alecto]